MHIDLSSFPDAHWQRLINFCGVADTHLRTLEQAMGITIRRRGEHLSLLSLTQSPHSPTVIQASIADLYAQAMKPLNTEAIYTAVKENTLKEKIRLTAGLPLHSPIVATPSAEKATKKNKSTKKNPDASEENYRVDALPPTSLNAARREIRPRTANQLAYIQGIALHDLVFGVGPAGTGKTYLAVASAVNALELGMVQRIILTRPALEAGEKLGFLPGSLAEKVDPYLRPVYDALYDMLGAEKFQRHQERGIIEIAPLAFMRGRTLNEAFVILDEAQNTTTEQMKMFLTRLGYGTKVVVNGDLTQTDLPAHRLSGLMEACQLLQQIEGVHFVHFDRHDVVRHPLVARIIYAYEQSDSRR
jgi:phosphate starvation-inducible PhoH-like protein